jgi:hypothetical protein
VRAVSVVAVAGCVEGDGLRLLDFGWKGRQLVVCTSAAGSSFISMSGWSWGAPLTGRDASAWRIDGSCIVSRFEVNS